MTGKNSVGFRITVGGTMLIVAASAVVMKVAFDVEPVIIVAVTGLVVWTACVAGLVYLVVGAADWAVKRARRREDGDRE